MNFEEKRKKLIEMRKELHLSMQNESNIIHNRLIQNLEIDKVTSRALSRGNPLVKSHKNINM